MNTMWMAWSPGAPEHERNIIILSYVKICNESPMGKYFLFASLWDINSSSMTQAMILLLAVMVMMIMMKKVTAFSKTTTLFEAQNSRKQCINYSVLSVAQHTGTKHLASFVVLAIRGSFVLTVFGLNVDTILCVCPSVTSVLKRT